MTLRDDILNAARARLGVPYGLPPAPGELDCSLYVLEAFKAAGIPFPAGVRTAEQIRWASLPITWDEALPGDILFYEGTYDAGPPSADGHIASHIGISLGAGSGRMLNAVEPTSRETDITGPYWQDRLFDVRRHPALAGAQEAQPVTVPARPRGIDVSSHQGIIDWPAVATSGISFAFIKATEDDGYVNPNFERDWPMARRVGLTRGAYHFARPEGRDAAEEAAYFLKVVADAGGLETGDLLALDLEAGAGDLGPWALEWLHAVEARVGFKPLVYTGAWFSGPHNLAAYPELGTYPLWLAAYQPQIPDPPAPWTLISFWQFTDALKVPGIRGNVDGNIFNGALERLPLLGKPGVSVPTIPTLPSPDLRARLQAVTDELHAILDSLPT